MKKILYVNPKENIELSYPDWLQPFMDLVWRKIKVKTVKPLKNGRSIKLMCFDEKGNL